MQLSIAIPGAEIVARAFREAPELIEPTILRAAWSAGLLLEREVKELTPVGVGAGGGLKGSIFTEKPEVGPQGVAIAVGTAMAYAEPVELGTKPHMPPVDALIPWVEAKLGIGAEQAEAVAYAIARKIKREGTEGAFMFASAFKRHAGQIERIFATGVAQLTQQMASRAGGGRP